MLNDFLEGAEFKAMTIVMTNIAIFVFITLSYFLKCNIRDS